jgi:hypothetical protein
MKAADYGTRASAATAFVATNSICQGQHVPILWPLISTTGHEIAFAYTSFKWANLASKNAGVTVIIVGLSKSPGKPRRLFEVASHGGVVAKDADNINAYLVAARNVIVAPQAKPYDERGVMEWGNKPTDGGHLLLTRDERAALITAAPPSRMFVKPFLGAQEFIHGAERYCLWIEDKDRLAAESLPQLANRIQAVAKMRASSKAAETRPAAAFPHRFRQIQSVASVSSVVVARVSSEQRDFLPVGLEGSGTIIGDRNFAIYDAPLWNMALVASRMHWMWIGTVCVRLEMRFSYSNTLGWNTFPVPPLTDQNKADLTRCAEDILLAREAHWPATIADLYDPDAMPADLRAAHDKNDDTLERIYIGRRFKNDTERLEKLFEMYTQMTAKEAGAKPAKAATPAKKAGGRRKKAANE